jgi:6-phosphogluconolactonase (cycloisomerase 2 family)
MLQKALALAIVVASIAVCTSCGTVANHYVYASLPAANQVIVFREDPNSGVLTQISGSPYSGGDGVDSLVLHPTGKFLYASNPGQNENDISLFNIATNGTPTEVLPRTSVAPYGTLPRTLLMDPGGAFLYVANSGSNNLSVFSINATNGGLTPVANSPFSIGLTPLNMLLSSSGKYLYVSAASQPFGLILTFSLNAGVPSLVSNGVTNTQGLNPNGLAINPSGSYLYAANTSSNSIAIFSIGSSGALTLVQGSPIADIYANPISLILDPAGQFLYVVNQANNNIAAYSISSSTGLPTILNISTNTNTSTTTGAYGTEASPSLVVSDPNGKYLFVGNQGSSAGIQSFSTSSGNLTEIFTYNIGNTPSSIAILTK